MHNYENRRLEIMKRKLIDSLPFERQVASAIDILRCVAWFEHIRDHLQKTGSRVCATAYGIGKFIQPETYAGVSPALYNHNMWPKYAAGLHCPGQVTLAAAEKKVPGSTAIYDASVWTMLNVTNPVGGQIDTGLRTLRVEVQEALYEKKGLRFGRYHRRKVGQATLSSLERHAGGLDALAAAVLLLKEACEAGDRERCFHVGLSLHRILLMTCVSMPVLSYRLPLIVYFSLFVFPLAASDSLIIDVPICEFYEMTDLLSTYVAILEDLRVIRAENARVTRERRRLLVGDLGKDLQFGLMPRLKVAPDCRDSRVAGRVASHTVGKDWGLSVLRQYGAVDFPPEETLLDMKAAYDQARLRHELSQCTREECNGLPGCG